MYLKDRLYNAVGDYIRTNHLTPVITAGARLCNRYLSCYWNEGHWDMHGNGELLLLRTLADHWRSSPAVTVFDVGANTGIYAKLVRQTLPKSVVHCFEIVPRTRATLSANLAQLGQVVISDCGLSNTDAPVEIGYRHENDTAARAVSPLSKGIKEVVTCDVQTGDCYLASRNIGTVDLLKIDTEGHEMAVLEGFAGALGKGEIRVIQFEYGTTWIAPRRFLHEAYHLLEPAGFHVGRLFPDGIYFKPYNRLEDEHFRMGNYVAVYGQYMHLLEPLNLNPKDSRTKYYV